MDAPTIENVLNDPATNVRYVFLAYRAMTREEKIAAYSVWRSSNPPPKPGSVVIIRTSTGIND